jgi:hypothetical protein
MSVFDAMNVVLAILFVIAAIGFLRLILPADRSQIPGTLLIITLIGAAWLLMALMGGGSGSS